jgi:predicted DsbA family dithiol-disulfide isomerase
MLRQKLDREILAESNKKVSIITDIHLAQLMDIKHVPTQVMTSIMMV